MIKWFLLQDDRVRGPFSEDEIRAQISDGHIDDKSMIWGRPLPTWQSVNWWLKESSQMTLEHQNEVSDQKWHYAIDGVSKGPLTRAELINDIKALRNKGEILIWTKGMKAWADLYEFHDLLDEMGLNRREHPRAQISGSVVVQFDGKSSIGVLRTIGPGGFGAYQLSSDLAIGQLVNVEIKSESLNESLKAKATIQYASENGSFGFKFQGINMEAKAIIMEYIRSTKGPQDQAA